MGKKWKKHQKRQQRQNQDFDFESGVVDDHNDDGFKQSNKSNGFVKKDIHSRLGWMKPSSNLSKKQKKKQLQIQKALALAGGDVDMGSDVLVSHKNKQKEGQVLSTGWHRITLTNAAKYSKESVLQTLVNALSLRSIALEPIAFKMQGPHYSFHVESPACASALKLLDKQLSVNPTDSLLRIKVANSPPPQMQMNDVAVGSMKQVMSCRYNAATGNLNLSRFHNDPAFLGQDVYVPLARSSVMNNVIKVINENVPQVASIDFSHNKLPTLDYFTTLETPNLKSINFEGNRLELRQLEKLAPLKLVELCLKDNPVMRDQSRLSETTDRIRDILPTLKVLDGVVLPKRISFEDDDDDRVKASMPVSVKKLTTNDLSVNELVLHFLREYFAIYDSDNREGLLQAYHEDAKFSLSAAYPPGCSAQGASKLEEYQLEARNLKLVLKKPKRQKLLMQDRLSTAALLTRLPKSSHNLDSFTLDIPFSSPGLVTFTVTGFFRERLSSSTSGPLRYFNRMFVVARSANGVAIVNDILFVTVPSKEQLKDLEAGPAQPAPSASAAPVTPLTNLAELVTNLSQATGMNQAFSRKCLEEMNWNYDLALSAFQNAFQQSQVPPEAFVK